MQFLDLNYFHTPNSYTASNLVFIYYYINQIFNYSAKYFWKYFTE